MSEFTLTNLPASESSPHPVRPSSGPLDHILDGFTNGERWLFVGPHDDDIVIAGGLILQAGLQAGAEIHGRIVTDGRMGYTREDQRASITAIRKEEAIASFTRVGLAASSVRWWNYPDSDLYRHTGRRAVPAPASASDGVATLPDPREGFSGLQNSCTADLRSLSPHRVFILSSEDYHPDHKIVHQEFLISLFHAQGSIWPELGSPLASLPVVYELAAYHDFSTPPDYEIVTSDEPFRRKLEAIREYRSQEQIETLVRGIEESGPCEYFRTLPIRYYRPATYRKRFHP